jgi:hypothetical protein
MKTAVLDINDCELRLWQGGELILASPGFALLQDAQYQFGQSARAEARLHPRNINHRFWWQLNTEPLQPSFGPGRHSADLVHGHLQSIFEQGQRPQQIILAVPGNLSSEQLSLLLGIVGECPFDIVGLVDRAVGAASTIPLESQGLHLELQLHQAVLTHLELADGHIQRTAATTIPGGGWLAIQDAIGNAIADAFIRQTRFDPRRKADTEQTLYDQLPKILEQLDQRNEYDLELAGHRARLEYSQMAEACHNHCQRIVQSLPQASPQLLLDSRLALLPGLKQQLNAPQILADNAAALAISKAEAAVLCEPSDIRFITRLPATAQASPAPAREPEPKPQPEPEQVRVPEPELEPSRFSLEYRDGDYHFTPGTGSAPHINGVAASAPVKLKVGDVVQVGDGPSLMIADPEQDDGSQA